LVIKSRLQRSLTIPEAGCFNAGVRAQNTPRGIFLLVWESVNDIAKLAIATAFLFLAVICNASAASVSTRTASSLTGKWASSSAFNASTNLQTVANAQKQIHQIMSDLCLPSKVGNLTDLAPLESSSIF
jgi:hypothetical protein